MQSTPTLTSASTATEIITWLLLVMSVFAVVARLSTKWATVKRLNWDDLACIISLVRDLHQRNFNKLILSRLLISEQVRVFRLWQKTGLEVTMPQ